MSELLSSSTHLPDGGEASLFAVDVLRGLSASRKSLAPKYFYDTAGSELFERITRLPEYYPTRAELAILERHARAIARLVPGRAALVEFGAGSTLKVRRLLPALEHLGAYVPVDISAEFLGEQAKALRADWPRLRVRPVVADFTRPFALPRDLAESAHVGFFPGSTIGNLEPAEAIAFLRHAGATLGEDAVLIVGVDLVKDVDLLHAAYNDAQGVTAAFNRNLLVRINRELGADFDVAAFEHRAFYNRQLGRIEMHLVSRREQQVHLLGQTIGFAEGETIHTENSYKYTVDGFRRLGERAGWTSEAVWLDDEHLFSVHALRQGAPRTR